MNHFDNADVYGNGRAERMFARVFDKLGVKFSDVVTATEDLTHVALQCVLEMPRVCCAIPGFRNERQARCNIAGAGMPLSPDDVAFVRETPHG